MCGLITLNLGDCGHRYFLSPEQLREVALPVESQVSGHCRGPYRDGFYGLPPVGCELLEREPIEVNELGCSNILARKFLKELETYGLSISLIYQQTKLFFVLIQHQLKSGNIKLKL